MRELTYANAIREATDQCMARDARVYVIGLGVTDPKGCFGTTLGLEEKYGPKRAMDMPTSENGMTGVVIGSALMGQRPIMVHQRIDFTLLALDQIVNNAANWHYMFDGHGHIPLVIRVVIGRGWGQGAQHAQSLQAFFAHVPGLKVVMPATPSDAKGLLVAAVEDPNPVMYIEHRWLHNTFGHVPEELYSTPIGKARILRSGSDATIVALSHMTIEALKAAEFLAADGIDAEVVDVRTLRPLDRQGILESVRRTGRLVVADPAWKTGGVSAEIVASVAEDAWGVLRAAPRRVSYPETPVPSSPALAGLYYPGPIDIVNAVRDLLNLPPRSEAELGLSPDAKPDVPDLTFTGPF